MNGFHLLSNVGTIDPKNFKLRAIARNTMCIREASNSDLEDVLSVERLAFGGDEEAKLVREHYL